MLRTVKSSGSASASSSQVSGADTTAVGVGRIEYAEAMVRSRAIWLKSTKIRFAALLLPPADRHVVGHPPAQLPAQGDHRVPGLDEPVRRLDRHEHVHAAPAAGLGEPDQAGVVQHPAQLVRGAGGVAEVGARLRVEVDPQLVHAARCPAARLGHGW